MNLKNLGSGLVIYVTVCVCSCLPTGSRVNNTDTFMEQQIMPKDTLLQRLSLAVSSLAGNNWDSAGIVQTFAAAPESFYLSVSSGKTDITSKTTVMISPENKYKDQFRLHINLPDTLASQISYDDLDKLFGEPVKDSIGGIPIPPPKEPIISYRIIKGKDTVNLVTYHTNQVNSERESIYGFFLYK